MGKMPCGIIKLKRRQIRRLGIRNLLNDLYKEKDLVLRICNYTCFFCHTYHRVAVVPFGDPIMPSHPVVREDVIVANAAERYNCEIMFVSCIYLKLLDMCIMVP